MFPVQGLAGFVWASDVNFFLVMSLQSSSTPPIHILHISLSHTQILVIAWNMKEILCILQEWNLSPLLYCEKQDIFHEN